MALVKCPECGKEISDKAKECPNCGIVISIIDVSENVEEKFNESIENDKKITKNEKKKNKNKKGLFVGIIVVVALTALIGGYFLFVKVIKPSNEYKKAEKLLSDGKYSEAQELYIELGDYKDSEEKIKECDYCAAEKNLENGDFETAKAGFFELEEYKDAKDKIKECDYQIALQYYADANYKETVSRLVLISDYKDSNIIMYKIYLELVGSDYMTECAKGVGYLGEYFTTQCQNLITYAYLASYGYSDDSWSPDLNDSDLKSMNTCANNINSYENEFRKVFTKEVMDNCKDESLNKAYDKFEIVSEDVNNLLTTQYAMDMISNAVYGISSEDELNTVSDHVKEYNDELDNLTKLVDESDSDK